MNILVLNGSPKGKRSNTYQLTSAFLEGISQKIKEQGNTTPEIVELDINRLDVKPCLGCFSCWNKTPGQCCISDDMRIVLEKLLWADLTVWSFPLYFFQVPGALKVLIDRQLPLTLPFMVERTDGVGNGSHPTRYDMSGKQTVLISTCGFYTAEGNYDSVTEMFDHSCGKDNYTTIFCGQGELFRVPELSRRTGEYLGYVREAGREYASGGISLETSGKLKQLLYPKDTFERMADASWGIDTQSGEKEEEALTFTKQMAALYQKTAYPGKAIVLEMHYTDVDRRYQILLAEEGATVLTSQLQPYTTCIETPLSLWRSIAAGEIRGDAALMQGKYRVLGDTNLMMNWDDYFGATAGQGGTGNGKEENSGNPSRLHIPDRATHMLGMLLPWMAFWILAAIDSFWGGLLSLAVCAVVPLLFYRHKKTVYDVISGAAVGAFSVASVAGIPALVIVPASYFAFGVMWCASCLLQIPLTAHYSMNAYKGEEALENPIFMKTNRILTAAWGALYLLTPIWTYMIMTTDFSSLVGAINSVLPIGMGIFTIWFQKWYPAKVMRGK